MNISDEICSIYPGTNIAKACSVPEVQKVTANAIQSSNVVSSHLSHLYPRTVEGMNIGQHIQVAHLLNKYSSVFSDNDDDIVTHKSTVARTVICRQDGRRRFPVLLDDLSKCRTNSQRKSQLS